MNFLELAKGRKSIRKFTDDKVSRDEINALLEAAQAAPSAGNLQPWHFYIMTDSEKIEYLGKDALKQGFAATAPLMIVVCAEPLRSASRYLKRGTSLYCIQDTAAAVQNILLCAHSLGLGGCWCGAFSEKKVSELLQIPAALRPVAIIPIGRPDQNPDARKRRPIDEIATFID